MINMRMHESFLVIKWGRDWLEYGIILQPCGHFCQGSTINFAEGQWRCCECARQQRCRICSVS